MAQCDGCEELENDVERLEAELLNIMEAAAIVCEAFDKGIFVRSTKNDADPRWAIKLVPYLIALGQVTGNMSPELVKRERSDAGRP